MKPFYFSDWTVIVFKSVHEEDDYLVLMSNGERSRKFSRVHAKSPQEAADKAWERYQSVKKEQDSLL